MNAEGRATVRKTYYHLLPRSEVFPSRLLPGFPDDACRLERHVFQYRALLGHEAPVDGVDDVVKFPFCAIDCKCRVSGFLAVWE